MPHNADSIVADRNSTTGQLRMVVISALICGFVIAVGSHATWQAPVESGQALAGLVNYPPDNPYYVYHMKLWSGLNQASTIMLRGGLSEITASILIVGFLGAISFLALSLLTFALCGSVPLALLTPLLMQQTDLVGYGVAYPIMLMGTSHSYGILGLSWLLLIVGVFGNGCYRAGGLLLGLALAIHPALGAFGVLSAGIALLLNRRTLRPHLMGMGSFFLLGSVVSAASLGWQLYVSAGLPQLDLASKRSYRDAFIANFDLHRNLGSFFSAGMLVAGTTLALSCYLYRKKESRPGLRLAAAMMAASVVVTVMLVVLAQGFPQADFLRMLMPWRFLNLANLAFVPLVIGLFAAGDAERGGFKHLLLLLFVVTTVVAARFAVVPLNTLYLLTGVALLMGLFLPLPTRLAAGLRFFAAREMTIVFGVLALLLALWAVTPAVTAIATGEYRSAARFPDRSNTSFFETVAGRPGMLLLATDLHLIQLFTRRPVLIDGGALDFFSYVPETGPQLNRILDRVYGLNIFTVPPPVQRNQGVITDIHRGLWEQWTVADWSRIAEEFAVTDIITPWDWQLALPLVAQDGGLKLYTIPRGAQGVNGQ